MRWWVILLLAGVAACVVAVALALSSVTNHGDIERIKTYRAEHRATIQEALKMAQLEGCAEYERITGFHEGNPNAIWHHRIALYGPPCSHCGKPLRTPKARGPNGRRKEVMAFLGKGYRGHHDDITTRTPTLKSLVAAPPQ